MGVCCSNSPWDLLNSIVKELYKRFLQKVKQVRLSISGSHPGFPVGERGPILGGMDLRCGRFSVKM